MSLNRKSINVIRKITSLVSICTIIYRTNYKI